jgi:hypothetical protein
MNTAEIRVANNKTHIFKMQNNAVMSPISPVIYSLAIPISLITRAYLAS